MIFCEQDNESAYEVLTAVNEQEEKEEAEAKAKQEQEKVKAKSSKGKDLWKNLQETGFKIPKSPSQGVAQNVFNSTSLNL